MTSTQYQCVSVVSWSLTAERSAVTQTSLGCRNTNSTIHHGRFDVKVGGKGHNSVKAAQSSIQPHVKCDHFTRILLTNSALRVQVMVCRLNIETWCHKLSTCYWHFIALRRQSCFMCSFWQNSHHLIHQRTVSGCWWQSLLWTRLSLSWLQRYQKSDLLIRTSCCTLNVTDRRSHCCRLACSPPWHCHVMLEIFNL